MSEEIVSVQGLRISGPPGLRALPASYVDTVAELLGGTPQLSQKEGQGTGGPDVVRTRMEELQQLAKGSSGQALRMAA